MSLTEDDLANALSAWGEGMISISSAYRQGGYEDAWHVAKKIIGELYGYAWVPFCLNQRSAVVLTPFGQVRKVLCPILLVATPVTLMIVDLQLRLETGCL